MSVQAALVKGILIVKVKFMYSSKVGGKDNDKKENI